MDFPRTEQPRPAVHPALRTALEALLATWVITLATTFAVNWILHIYGYSAALGDTMSEAHRWFLPMFAYLCGMFWMIDSGGRRHYDSPRV